MERRSLQHTVASIPYEIGYTPEPHQATFVMLNNERQVTSFATTVDPIDPREPVLPEPALRGANEGQVILVGWSEDSYNRALSAAQNSGLHVQYGGYVHDNSLTAFVPVGAPGVTVPMPDVSAEHVVQGYRVPAASREDCMSNLAPIKPLYTLTPEAMARYHAT